MINQIDVNLEQKSKLSDFVKAIVETAYNPRSKRGYLDNIKITGSAEELPHSTEDKYYRFEASFVRTYGGEDCQFAKPCTYAQICNFEHGKSHETECIDNNLRLIQEEIRRIALDLESRIEGRVLVVESAFHTLSKKTAPIIAI